MTSPRRKHPHTTTLTHINTQPLMLIFPILNIQHIKIPQPPLSSLNSQSTATMPTTYSSSSSSFYSSSSSSRNGNQTSGERYATTSQTNPDGTRVVRSGHQELGGPTVVKERRYDETGRQQLPSTHASSGGGARRITDLDDDEEEESR